MGGWGGDKSGHADAMRAAIHLLGLLLAAPTAAWSVRTVRGLAASQRSARLLPSAVRCCATEGEGVAYAEPKPKPEPAASHWA